MSALAALAFALAGIHIGEARVMPIGDAASVRIRIAWLRGYPTVRVLRSCPATLDC